MSSEQYVGEIRAFGFNFALSGWAFCQGQLLSISQNTTLYTLVGTTYGGDGVQTFGVPNLGGRLAINQGQGAGLTNRVLGTPFGEEAHSLLITEVPGHNHRATAGDGVAFASQSAAPTSTSYLGREKGGSYAASSNTIMAATMISTAGGGLPHPNVQPTLTMNYCIAQFGIFPSQN
jgi:microcystin-dependent protein